jgi:hypothetical protein
MGYNPIESIVFVFGVVIAICAIGDIIVEIFKNKWR